VTFLTDVCIVSVLFVSIFVIVPPFIVASCCVLGDSPFAARHTHETTLSRMTCPNTDSLYDIRMRALNTQLQNPEDYDETRKIK